MATTASSMDLKFRTRTWHAPDGQQREVVAVPDICQLLADAMAAEGDGGQDRRRAKRAAARRAQRRRKRQRELEERWRANHPHLLQPDPTTPSSSSSSSSSSMKRIIRGQTIQCQVRSPTPRRSRGPSRDPSRGRSRSRRYSRSCSCSVTDSDREEGEVSPSRSRSRSHDRHQDTTRLPKQQKHECRTDKRASENGPIGSRQCCEKCGLMEQMAQTQMPLIGCAKPHRLCEACRVRALVTLRRYDMVLVYSPVQGLQYQKPPCPICPLPAGYQRQGDEQVRCTFLDTQTGKVCGEIVPLLKTGAHVTEHSSASPKGAHISAPPSGAHM